MATLKLTTPIITHKGTVSEIDLKSPTVRLFIRHGSPFQYIPDEFGNLFPKYDDKVMVKFIADMSGIDEIALEEMSGYDYFMARNEVLMSIMKTTGNKENPPT